MARTLEDKKSKMGVSESWLEPKPGVEAVYRCVRIHNRLMMLQKELEAVTKLLTKFATKLRSTVYEPIGV